MVKERNLVEFVDWAPRFKCGIQYNPELWVGSDENNNRIVSTIPRSCVLTSNSLAVRGIFSKIGEQFDKLYTKVEPSLSFGEECLLFISFLEESLCTLVCEGWDV